MRGHENSSWTPTIIVFSLAFTIVIAQLLHSSHASPLTSSFTTSAGGNSPITNGGPIFNVTRVFNSGDVFANTDPKCDPTSCVVWGATQVRSSPCHCQCPSTKPAFLQHLRQCANQIEECKMVEFNQSGIQQKIPTVFLPLSGQSIASSWPINWEAAGIRLEANGSAPCSVSGGGYLTQNGWIALDSDGIFSLYSTTNHTFLQWHGSKQDQLLLTGKVVQVTFRCVPGNAADFCAVFRVIGKDVNPLSADGSGLVPQPGASTAGGGGSNERANQLGLIVGIVCGALLAVTLVSVAVFWTVCWKQQKERMARKMQLHVLYQQQRMQQQAAAGAFPHLANAFTAMNEPAVSSAIEMLQNYQGVPYYGEPGQQQCWIDPQQHMTNEEMARRYLVDQRGGLLMASNPSAMLDPRNAQSAADQLILPPPPPYPHARKKLYFSPEFFEHDLMVDPPPVAEEFLYEVRRMIDLAKNRIRSRRYIPSLLVIPEEGSSRGMEAERKVSEISNYSLGRSHAVIERRDSFSKMAQEPAPEETLTIQELEHEREQADSPRSSGSADSRTAGDSSGGGPPSSSSGCEGGGGDRSSGEAVSGGRISLDSGLGGDDDSSSNAKKSSEVANDSKTNDGDKVSHWLSRLPPTVEIEETDLLHQPQPTNPRHSKLFNYFNARQRLAQNQMLDRPNEEQKNLNIIRVQVNEDAAATNTANATSPKSPVENGPYRRRYSHPLATSGHQVPKMADGYRGYKNPELAALTEATNIDQSRLREVIQKVDVHQPNYWRGQTSDARKIVPSQIYGSEMTENSVHVPSGTMNGLPGVAVDDHSYMNGLSQSPGTKIYYNRPMSALSAPSSVTVSASQSPSHAAYFGHTRDQSA